MFREGGELVGGGAAAIHLQGGPGGGHGGHGPQIDLSEILPSPVGSIGEKGGAWGPFGWLSALLHVPKGDKRMLMQVRGCGAGERRRARRSVGPRHRNHPRGVRRDGSVEWTGLGGRGEGAGGLLSPTYVGITKKNGAPLSEDSRRLRAARNPPPTPLSTLSNPIQHQTNPETTGVHLRSRLDG